MDDRNETGAGLGGVKAGDQWSAADGRRLTVTMVRRIGLVAYRQDDGQERFMDIIRFVRTFSPVTDATMAPAHEHAA